ncbi:phospholipid carrier-dependent glycosyltransferase [Candidatus Woesebacteria bacterium]|nr:phospholipid carrier-dependent glycosyltransferase [Candidatus Woesebacteria bacterium]
MLKQIWQNKIYFLTLVWVTAILIRLYGLTIPAQYYDIGTYESWSRSFWLQSPSLFFSTVWSDYLPLPILTFAPISLVADFFHLPFGIVFKLLHIVLELILIFFIAKSTPKSSIFSLSIYLLLLSPALIGDNAFWGQVDTIPALLALLSLTKIINPQASLLSSSILFGLAVAYKPIMVLVAPVLWLVTIVQKRPWWQLPTFSMITFFLTGVPTGGLGFVSHIFDRITSQTGTYPFLTVNAFNFWSLHPNLSWIPDSTSVFNLSGQALGTILFVSLTLFTFNAWRKQDFSPQYAWRVAATIMVIFFTFTTRMHERHLLFGLPFLTLAAMTDYYLLIPLTLLTTTFTLNLYGAYYWVNHAQIWPFSLSTISLISWVTVLAALLLVFVWSWPSLLKSIFVKVKSNQLLVGILIFASLLRFVNLSHPPAYIFDEVYHAFTSREYLNNHVEAWEWWTTPPEGVAYEWTHPPLAKYCMVAGMLLFGENSLGWRFGSATFGVVSLLGLYLFLTALTSNKHLALLATFLVSIEGLHLVQSRIAMNDTYMLCFYTWSMYLAVKSRWKGAAILYGLALASKWSALYGIVPLALLYLHQNPLRHWHLKSGVLHFLFAVRLSLIVLTVYTLTFTPFILAGHTWAQWWELHRQMWYYHTHLVATHAYQSTPIKWIFDLRPVWYYVNYQDNFLSNIYAIGNPIILWLGLFAAVINLKYLFLYPYSILYSLYFVLFIPWVISPRIMFFYHYLPSAYFLTTILASWLVRLNPLYRRLLLVLSVLGLLLISPMIYGLPTSNIYWDNLFKLFPTWR